MSLKKKKNGSKGKSAKRNDSDQDRMLAEARKELINQATRLQELIEEENSISRGFCTQTDKLRSFKEIQQGELEVKRRSLKERQNTLMTLKDSYSLDISALKHSVKKALVLQQNEIAAEKIKSESFVNELKDVNHSKLVEMGQEKINLEKLSEEYKLSHFELGKSMKKKHSQMITDLRKDYENRFASLSKHAQQNERVVRNKSDKILIQKADSLEEENVESIKKILTWNEEALEEIRRCFKESIKENTGTINNLKIDLIHLKREECNHTRELIKATYDSNLLRDPLQQAKGIIDRLSKEVDSDTKERNHLELTRNELSAVQNRLEVTKWHHEVLFQQCQKLEKELSISKNNE